MSDIKKINVVALTTIPSRVKYLPEMLDSLASGLVLPDRTYLFLPRKSRKENVPYDISKINLNRYSKINLVIEWVPEDCGPGTKLLPIFTVIPRDFSKIDPRRINVINVDDDHYYSEKMLSTLVLESSKYPGSSVGYYGLNVGSFFNPWIAIREDFNRCNIEADILAASGGVLYPYSALLKAKDKLLILPNYHYQEAKYVDDVWFSTWIKEMNPEYPLIITRLPGKIVKTEADRILALHLGNADSKGVSGYIEKIRFGLLNRRVILHLRGLTKYALRAPVPQLDGGTVPIGQFIIAGIIIIILLIIMFIVLNRKTRKI